MSEFWIKTALIIIGSFSIASVAVSSFLLGRNFGRKQIKVTLGRNPIGIRIDSSYPVIKNNIINELEVT